jgi:uncharacterized protein YybS (DUF2232 family)
MNKINTRALAEGAILAALTAIMGIFYNIPIISFITLFWPVPIVIVGYRNGFRISILSALIAALLVAIIISPVVGFILFTIHALPGTIMGYMLRKKVGIGTTVAVCGVLLAITGFLQLAFIVQMLLNTNIMDILLHFNTSMDQYFDVVMQGVRQASEIYQRLGLSKEMMDQSVTQMQDILVNAKLLLPSAILMMGMCTSYINFKAVRLILNRMGYNMADMQRFADWSLGRRGKFALAGIAILMIAAMYSKIEALNGVYLNLLYALNLILLIAGLSLLNFLMEQMTAKYEIPKGIYRLLLVVVVLLFFRFLPYMGLFDMVADVRRLFTNTEGGVR